MRGPPGRRPRPCACNRADCRDYSAPSAVTTGLLSTTPPQEMRAATHHLGRTSVALTIVALVMLLLLAAMAT